VNHIQGEGDAAEVLVEAQLEEGFQPPNARDGGGDEDGSPKEIEPFEVPGCLGCEEGNVAPARGFKEDFVISCCGELVIV
jgi:hypothetical protein